MDLREADVNTNYVFDIDRTIAGQRRLPGAPLVPACPTQPATQGQCRPD